MDAKFLQHYFQPVADKLKIPLSYFTPPTNSKAKTWFKSINEEYLELIKHSALFVQDFNSSLEPLKSQYFSSLHSKISFFLLKITRLVELNSIQSAEDLESYI